MAPQKTRIDSSRQRFIEATTAMQGIEKVKAHLQMSLDNYENPQDHDWLALLIPHIVLHSYSSDMPHPRINFRFTVLPIHCNQLGNLHGGCAATLFDLCTTLPLGLIPKPSAWEWLGVSRTLNVTYLRPVPVNSTIDIESVVIQAGKNLATMKGVMRAVDSEGNLGSSLALCEHGKVSIDPPPAKL